MPTFIVKIRNKRLGIYMRKYSNLKLMLSCLENVNKVCYHSSVFHLKSHQDFLHRIIKENLIIQHNIHKVFNFIYNYVKNSLSLEKLVW